MNEFVRVEEVTKLSSKLLSETETLTNIDSTKHDTHIFIKEHVCEKGLVHSR